MSLRHAVKRLEAAPEPVPPPLALPEATPEEEPRQLARELAHALADELAKYRRAAADRAERPDPSQPPPDSFLQALLDTPAQDMTFIDLYRLERVNPELAQERWNAVRDQAAADLASGWLAARVLEPLGGSAWERACFFALLKRLRQGWAPRDDAEALLLSEFAQYEMLRQRWLGLLAEITGDPLMVRRLLDDKDGSSERKFTQVEAAREAMRMVERCHRLAQQTLRTFLSLRRPGRSVFVGRAGQVNLANGPQQNINPT